MANTQVTVQGVGSVYIGEDGKIHVHHETICANQQVCDAAAERVKEALGPLGAQVLSEQAKPRFGINPATQQGQVTQNVTGEQVYQDVEQQQRLYRQQ